MTKVRFAICTVALACAVETAVFAQEETGGMNTSVDVVNTYQPTLRRARKIVEAPLIDDTVATKPSKFDYQTLNRISVVTTKPQTLSPASMDFPASKTPYRALVEGAVGYTPTLYGQITYNMGASKRYHLSAKAGHHARLGEVKLEDGSKVDAPHHDTWAGLNFNRFSSKLKFGFDVNFSNAIYNYYGLNTIADSLSYYTENGREVSGSEILDPDKQRNTGVNLEFGLANIVDEPLERISFDAKAGFGFFGNKSGVHQTNFFAGSDLRFPIKGATAIDATVAVNHFKTQEGDSSALYDFYERKGTDIRIHPHFALIYDFLTVRLGMKFTAIVGDDNVGSDDFLVQPDIQANVFVGDGSVRIYAALTGDYKMNNYVSLLKQNRYLSPDMRKYMWMSRDSMFITRADVVHSQYPIIMKLGARASFTKMLQFHLAMQYESLGDEVLFVNRNFANVAGSDTTFAHSSQFALTQEDGKLFRLHGEVNVNPSERGNVRLAATYYKYNMDYAEEAWYRPNFELSVSGHFLATERLKVKASLEVEGKRYGFDPTLRRKVELPTILDLSLGAHYYISNRWTAFASFSNMTANEQRRWLGYSSFRFNGMAGITYKF